MKLSLRKRVRKRECAEAEAAGPDRNRVPAHWRDLLDSVRHATMTSDERLVALCEAVAYVCRNDIVGDMVECGVWRGGSMMAVAKTLLQLRGEQRHLWLYDTFDGMTAPTVSDVDLLGQEAQTLLDQADRCDAQSVWCRSGLSEVQFNLDATGYPQNKISYIVGDVLETLSVPAKRPQRISLLRLDTDWHASTRIELEQLFPLLSPGGVLIIDDYGHWGGCRKATDEHLAENDIRILLHRIDYTGRIAIKQDCHPDGRFRDVA